ncbi:unnamed protein product [Phytophthora fragariaefolia]|uniref:Unnamed protein product n=1 Tax=Phytophthora fragariaefolia TaxID=1490495 RepID=A0A9W7CTR8_9STRA|nr:unnamed protein product [Phytophthora fragariaefolia]
MDRLPGLRDEEAGAPKRGRPPSALSTNFYRLNEKCNKTMWWTVCKYCYAAHVKDKTAIPFLIHVHGRKEAWEKHLSECLYFVATGNAFRSIESEGNAGEHGRATKTQCTSPPEFMLAEKLIFWRLLLEFQAEALLPDTFVALMSFRRLLVFLNARCGVPGAVPHRHILGGRVLDEHADLHSIEQRDTVRSIQNRSGGRGVRPADDRHDGIAIAQQMEGVLEVLLASEWRVGAVESDNAGQCGRARRILALRYPSIAFVHCFVHDVNNLVKSILRTVFKQVSADAAGAASFLNTSTSKWLVRAAKAMNKRYGDHFAIFTRCETRWNSIQACFASLLRARGALEDMVFSYRNSSELTGKLRVLGDVAFWTKLQSAEKIVRPLCAASFRLQRDENTVADVVVSFIEIYRGFSSTEHRAPLTELVEARWSACEQPLFILGFFLHPKIVVQARKFPSTVITDLDDVCQFAQYYYRRFVGSDDSGLRGEMFKWIQGTYTTSHREDFDDDLVLMFWETSSSSYCSASSSNADGDGTSAEAGRSVGRGTSDCDADQHGGNPSGDGATDSATNSTGNGAPFATTRLGSHADPSPAANRRPYPPDNDPCFPQEKRYTGIRARKASLASLVTHA